MNLIWKTIRKPFVWRSLFVLSVYIFSVLMGNKAVTSSLFTFFAAAFVFFVVNPSSQSYVRRKSHLEDTRIQSKSYLQEASDKRLTNYGSRANYSMDDRNRMFKR